MTRKAGPHTGTGLVSSYSFDFKVFAAADVRVTRTNLAAVDETLTLDDDYTVSLNAGQDPPGGSVILAAPLPIDFRLTLTSDVSALQPTSITNSGGFYPDIVETALDRQTILAQQVIETLSRSITLPVSLDPSISTRLGAPVPNGVLAWNGSGNQLVTTTPEALAVSVNADDVRAALLAPSVINGDTLRAPTGDAVSDAIAAEASARLVKDALLENAVLQEVLDRAAAIGIVQGQITATLPPGAIVDFDLDSAPPGFVAGDGGTIGDASSGATTRANADTLNLFAAQWARDASLRPIYTSAGALSTRGATAAADFAAHKAIRIGDLRDRVTRGYKSGGLGPGIGATQEDAMQRITGEMNGFQSNSLVVNDLATKTGVFADTSHNGEYGNGGGGDWGQTIRFDSADSVSPNTARTNDVETRVKSFGTLKCYKL